jgi:hypothetical protein
MSVVVDDERGDERRSRGEEGDDRKQIIRHDMDMHGNNLISSARRYILVNLHTWSPLGPQYKVVRTSVVILVFSYLPRQKQRTSTEPASRHNNNNVKHNFDTFRTINE